MTSFAASKDGSFIAIGVDEKRDLSEHVLELWDTKTNKRRFRVRVPLGTFTAMAFSRTGEFLATGSDDGTMRIWNTSTGRITESASENCTISSVIFDPSRRLLAYTTTAKELANCKLIRIGTGTVLKSWNVDSHGATIVRFSRDGNKLVTVGGEFTIRVWDIKDVWPPK